MDLAMKYKAIVFDLDGTILDTLRDLAESVNLMLAKNGFPVHDVDSYRMRIGNGARNLVRQALPAELGVSEAELDCLLAEFKVIYGLHDMDTTCPYDGVVDVLQSLAMRGVPMAVCSNKPHGATVKLVGHFFREGLFNVVCGEKEGVPRKPNPAGPLWIAECLGLPPKEILFVGDSGSDMLTGVAARMVPVGVSWGLRDRVELLENGAVFVADQPGEIVEFFFSSEKLEE